MEKSNEKDTNKDNYKNKDYLIVIQPSDAQERDHWSIIDARKIPNDQEQLRKEELKIEHLVWGCQYRNAAWWE